MELSPLSVADFEQILTNTDACLTRQYQALLETFWTQPWFAGIYWWHWGTHEKMGGANHRGFTPQNKPAQELVAAWYRKRR